MVWNAVNRQHEATIPLPIGTHEFKFVILCGYFRYSLRMFSLFSADVCTRSRSPVLRVTCEPGSSSTASGCALMPTLSQRSSFAKRSKTILCRSCRQLGFASRTLRTNNSLTLCACTL